MAMDKAKVEIEIARSLNDVFLFTSNLKNLPYWGEVMEVVVNEETRQGVGSTYTAIVKTLFTKAKIPLEVIQLTPPSNFTFRNQKLKSNFVFTFTPTITGTKVVLENVVDSFSFALSDNKLTNLLKNIKKHLEPKQK